jgi:predicted O-methyltransferase YrrM
MQPLKALVKRVTPKPLLNLLRLQLERNRLRAVRTISADFAHLRKLEREELNRLFLSETINAEWREVEGNLKRLGLWNPPGGTGAPDVRALYFLTRHYEFSSVLEVGTHVGCSTFVIASALSALPEGVNPELVTVDIVDVNDEVEGPWRHSGLELSPSSAIEQIDAGFAVEFVRARSADYLRNNDQRFDFIYLDGDHTADSVYEEIALAASRLRPDGIIALHDYSPRLVFQSYYDGWTVPGPFLAVERISREHDDVEVMAPGKLPWMTGQSVSLLTLLSRP